MKKIISLISVMALVLTLSTSFVFADNSFYKEENGVAITVELDKEVYSMGQKIKVVVTTKNISDKTLYYLTGGINKYDPAAVRIYYNMQTDKEFYCEESTRFYSTISSRKTIEPGEEKVQTVIFTAEKISENKPAPIEEGRYQGLISFSYAFSPGKQNYREHTVDFGFPVVVEKPDFTGVIILISVSVATILAGAVTFAVIRKKKK